MAEEKEKQAFPKTCSYHGFGNAYPRKAMIDNSLTID